MHGQPVISVQNIHLPNIHYIPVCISCHNYKYFLFKLMYLTYLISSFLLVIRKKNHKKVTETAILVIIKRQHLYFCCINVIHEQCSNCFYLRCECIIDSLFVLLSFPGIYNCMRLHMLYVIHLCIPTVNFEGYISSRSYRPQRFVNPVPHLRVPG